MQKMVVILDKEAAHSADDVARELDAIPGVSVTAKSASLIDVEALEDKSAQDLRELVRSRGLTVESVTDPELIEPISPFDQE